ncbi:MAG: hypothetical protein ABFD08_13720 [Syntrophomonas sp.]
MKKRWVIYIVIGVLFGVFDFYYQEFTSGIITSYAIWFLVAWGIWLVPAIPVALYESKVSESRIMSALANVLTWSVSAISYYLYMAFKLIFIGQTSMQFLHISHYRDQFYLSNLKSLFLGDVLIGISQWIGVAVVGGLVIGFLISYIYLCLRKTPVTELD